MIATDLPLSRRLSFSDQAQPFRLRSAPPYVCGYAWRHPAPAASLVLIHGLQSHAGWFAEAGELLNERGLSVYAVDRRGSGSSPGRRGDIGRYRDWLAEVEMVVNLARNEHPDAPVHLVGHCFGANIAMAYVLDGRAAVSSIVMLTPGVAILPDYSVTEKARIAGSAFLRPEARFPVPQDDELFTRDPEVLAWIRGDTLGSKTLTARCLLQINQMVRGLRRRAREISVPVLVLEAARDRISDNAGNRLLLEGALGGLCQYRTFDAEHFLLAEPCRDEVLDAVAAWVRR